MHQINFNTFLHDLIRDLGLKNPSKIIDHLIFILEAQYKKPKS